MTHQWEVGKEYKTRGGYVATIFDVNFHGRNGRTIIGKVKAYGREEIFVWKSDGSFLGKEHPDNYDLMPPVETQEIWVNIYPAKARHSSPRAWADEAAGDNRIGLLKITITGDEFEVEKVAI